MKIVGKKQVQQNPRNFLTECFGWDRPISWNSHDLREMGTEPLWGIINPTDMLPCMLRYVITD